MKHIALAAFLALFAIPHAALCAATEQYADVGGSHIHAHVTGEGPGPAVIFESGMGEDSTSWSSVQPAVAKNHLTLSYDRAGLGSSTPGSQPRDARTMAHELHDFLLALHIAPPYILVGHSLGGYVLRVFAHDYPTDVQGLVFVDPVPEQLEPSVKAHMPPRDYANRLASIQRSQGAMPAAVRRESDSLILSGTQAAAATPLPDVPTVLLTATKKNPRFPGNPLEQDLKLALHREFVLTLHHAMHVLVPESRHYIQNDQPQAVIDAIRAVSGIVADKK